VINWVPTGREISQEESSNHKEGRLLVMVEKIDRRTTDTKERIIQEALQLYKQGGFAAVKLNDITKVLHVTRAALYNHFPEGKDQIFLEAFTSMAQQLEARITEIMDSVPDTRQRLKKMLLLVASTSNMIDMEMFFTAQQELSQTTKDRMKEAIWPLMNKILLVIQEGMARGDLRTVELPLALAYIGMLFHQFRQLTHGTVKLPPELRFHGETEVLIDQMLDLWFTGIANREQRDLPTEAD
jgi:AcrR family transcriptional regulator